VTTPQTEKPVAEPTPTSPVPDLSTAEAADPPGTFEGKPPPSYVSELLSAVVASGVVGGGNAAPITIALGDAIGRDKVNTTKADATTEHAMPRVLSREARSLYRVHAWPTDADTVRGHMASGHMSILTGSLGSGKAALAVNLLTETCTEIYELSRLPTPSEVNADFFREGCGYLLADLPQRAVVQIADSDLPRLADVVARSGAKLVLTVEPSFTHVPSSLDGFVIPLTEPASPVEVLGAHLRHHVGAEEAARILARPEVKDLVRASLTAGEVAMLGYELAGRSEVLNGQDLGWRLGQQRRAAVERWLADVPDAHWPFLLSLAVLDGLPFETVVQAARHFSTLAEADPLVDVPPLTAAERARLLETARAEVVPAKGPSWWGLVPTEEVRFRHRGIAQWVLDYLWRHSCQLREVVIAWLAEAGGLIAERPRQKFAAAVGQLMTQDFRTLEKRIFTPWVTGDVPWHREAALVALAVASVHPDLRLVMVRMMLQWMRGEYWERWMAARSLGEPLGHVVPESTLALLGELAKDTELRPYAVGQAMREFADGVTAKGFELMLDTLSRWATGANDKQRHVALYSFLQICAWVMDPDNKLPRVLTRPVRQDMDPAVLLWRQAIVDPQVHLSARQTLFGWARRCDGAESERLAGFLTRVATTDRLNFLVRRAAESWRTDKFPATRSATAVLAAVRAREGEHVR
jgi:hypothetical protein